MKQLLFTVTAKDCDWWDEIDSGPGGQHKNRTHSAIRVRHRASGAEGRAAEHKSQVMNKRAAFERMANSKKFKMWHRLETARRMANAQSIEKMINEAVERALGPGKVKVEVKDEKGRWVDAGTSDVRV